MNLQPHVVPATPPGLDALFSLCRRVYPNQPNPLQVTALVKYWLGGPDPLDYISMYSNPGDAKNNTPPHWHYISFGLSDLHGDGRVHEVTSNDSPSGFGFELTFRLKREPGEASPPTWPAALMQALAKYVFQSGNTLCSGDHVSWHNALDNGESRIQHMLMTEDPVLGSIQTPLGNVTFIQIIGVCREELQAAQRWNGAGVIDILKRVNGLGGPWLVTDMRRGESVLELDVCVQEEIEHGIDSEGSNLSGVSARCAWVEADPDYQSPCISDNEDSGEGGFLREGPAPEKENQLSRSHGDEPIQPSVSEEERTRIKAELRRGLLNNKNKDSDDRLSSPFDSNGNSCRKNSFEDHVPQVLESTELLRTRRLDGLHLTFNLESGLLLPLAIRGRVLHGRHFTFKSVLGDTAITFVASSVTGTFVTSDNPFVAHGPWLQVLVSEDLAQQMSENFELLNNDIALPKTFMWKEHKLMITIVPD
ncbi:hypothetical protein ONE63_002920 [Megalurothrips usitatus]|uniref:Suppressor of fused homolog n=1 Tax=Megalurothrips usitatus TaxID=439358 RepID=A0AAV7XCQ5_9NEOP|nr:hypothetical protein ONE63_002920 [Megalurothrips usitatus]